MALTTQPPPVKIATPFGMAADVVIHGEERASQSYKKGAFLIDDDSGLIKENAAGYVDGGGVTRRTLGIALGDATGTTSHDVAIGYAGAYTVFEGTLTDLSAGTHTLAAGDKWQTFTVRKGTYNWYLDYNTLSANGAFIVGFKDAVGTVDGRVYFVLTAACRGGMHAASGAI